MKLTLREMTTFAFLGGLMYASKIALEWAPNIHLLGVFTVAFTIVYRKKALYPIYTYVFLNGLLAGFSTWWYPHLYLWLILWAVVMLLPRTMPVKAAILVYMLVCSAHGFLYGTLYAPFQAIAFGMNLEGMIAWIIAGFPFDAIHGISNFFSGILIMPIVHALKLAERGMGQDIS